MKKLLAVVAIMAVAGLVSSAFAQDQATTHHVNGKIVKVDEGGKLTIHPRRGEDVVVTTNAQTKITLDEKEAKVSDLKAGLYVRIVADKDELATKIIASTTPPRRRGNNPPASAPAGQ